jgi:hypothetical protein
MVTPFFLLLISLIGVLAAFTEPGLLDLILVAAPSALASLFLLLRAFFLRRGRYSRLFANKNRTTDNSFVWKNRPTAKNYIVIDGSNAMHWKDGSPQIDTLRDVVAQVAALGYTPGVVFDANAGHLIAGKYQHNRAMGKLLGLPEDRVMVVDKGAPADPTILEAARFLGARIVTNDRYRDWATAHPEVNEPGHLIRGGYREGKLWLGVGPSEPAG